MCLKINHNSMSKIYSCILKFVVTVALIAGGLHSCEKKEPEIRKDTYFGFIRIAAEEPGINSPEVSNEPCNDPGSGGINERVPSAVILTIERNGNIVYEDHKLPLSRRGDEYVSAQPLPLPIGGNRLTDFVVSDKKGNPLYVSPYRDTDFAPLVDNPLPLSFSVEPGETNKLEPEVLHFDPGEDDPVNFGYTSFSFSKVEVFSFLISVFLKEGGEYETAGGYLTVEGLKGDEEAILFMDDLSEGTERVIIRGEYEMYRLTVEPAGNAHEPYIKTFTRRELEKYTSEEKGPLKVVF